MERRTGSGRRLTDRQATILELVARGLANKEIAYALGISVQGVKDHVSVLLTRFGATNRGELGGVAATRRLVGGFMIADDWLRFLFVDAPVPIAIVVGPQHRLVAFNRAYERAAGSDELLGLNYADVFPRRVSIPSLSDVHQAYATGARVVAEGAVLEPLPGDDEKSGGVAVFLCERGYASSR